MEADANGSLITPEGQGGSRGEAGDIFTSPDARLLNSSTPSPRLNSGAPSDVSIYSLVVDGDVARVQLSTRVLGMGGLLEEFFGVDAPGVSAESLTADERSYVDRLGNSDGTYDLGDFRSYVLSHPSSVVRWEVGR